MSHDDDEDWFDALAGRPPATDTTRGTREGHELRATLQRANADVAVGQPTRDKAREAELIARAQREGLIGKRARSRSFWRPASSLVPAWSLAVVVCLAIGIAVFLQPTSQPIVERGSDGVILLRASDPVSLQRDLLDELKEVGVDAVGYERLGLHGIDADLPQPLPDNVRVVLERHGIDAPSDGILLIEISEAP